MSRRSLVVVVVMLLSCWSASADEAAASRVARSFYEALAGGDVDSAARLWTSTAPDRAARMREYRIMLATAGGPPFELRELSVTAFTPVAADRFRLDLDVSLVGSAGKSLFHVPKSRRVMTLLRAGTEIRIESELSLADTQVAARGEDAASASPADPELPLALHREAARRRQKGQYDVARRLADLALRTAREQGDRVVEAAALNEIGALFYSQSAYEESLRFYNESLALRREIGDRRGTAASLANIGVTHRLLGDYERALELYGEALELGRAIGDDELRATVLTSIAIVHSQQGRYAEALRHFGESLAVQEKLGNSPGMATALNSLGGTYARQGNQKLARQAYEKSLSLHRATQNNAGAASVLNNLGVSELSEGNMREAADALHESLVLKTQLGDLAGVASVQTHLGALAREAGALEDALCWLEASRRTYENVDNRAQLPPLLFGLGKLAADREQWALALDYAIHAAEEARLFGRAEYIWRSQSLAGQALARIGAADGARVYFEDAVKSIEQLRANVAGGEEEQTLFFERAVDPYHGLFELAVRRRDPAEALRWAEQARGRVLLDVVRYGRAADSAPEPQAPEAKLVRDLRRVGGEIARARTKAAPDRLAVLLEDQDRLRSALSDLRSRRLAADSTARRREGGVSAVSLPALRQSLDRDTAIVEYVVTKDAVFAVVITASAAGPRAAVKRIGSAAEVRRQSERLHQHIARRDLGFRRAAIAAHGLLVAPIRASLRAKKRWVIVPDGPLWLVPFQALVGGDGRFVVQEHEISYAPSVAVWHEMQGNRGSRARHEVQLAAFDTQPDDKSSVSSLRALYPEAQRRLFEGAAAAESKFKREIGKARIVHVAAHGVFDDRRPLSSNIQLGSGDGEDGVVQAWEILDLQSTSDLVILSACETARGRSAEGEGLIGLSWALFVAGCPTTVVGQWKVDSESTRQLMTEFHRALRQDGSKSTSLPVASALRSAALKMIERPETRHPFHWAAFGALGAAR